MFARLSVLASLTLASAVASACPTGMTEYAKKGDRTVCRFTSNDVLNKTVTLTPEFDYQLIQQADGQGKPAFGTYIGGDNSNASTLIILPGVTVYGDEKTFLSVSRGSKIVAEGTKEQPIVFTSSNGEARRGVWGGILINGNAPINSPADASCGGGIAFEGVEERSVCFGGNTSDDSSGSLKFMRVEFGGYPIKPNKEINGFTFNGVGNGTQASYLQAHMIADDCFEFFGGTIDLRYLICTGGDDDGIDADMGYVGRIQYALVHFADDIGDNGFEWDNHPKLVTATPRTNPKISNATIIGGAKSGYGMMLRQGTASTIMNSIFTGFTKGCVNIDNPETLQGGVLLATSTVVNCAKNFEVQEGESWSVESWFLGQGGNEVSTVKLNGYILDAGSPLQNKGVPSDDFFFEETSFIGAIGSASSDWTAGWMRPL